MDRSVIAEITSYFKALSSIFPLHTISSERDCHKTAATLNQLLDAGGTNEKHPLADRVNTLGALMSEYDNAQYPEQDVSALVMLRFLMGQNHLTQTNPSEACCLGWQHVN